MIYLLKWPLRVTFLGPGWKGRHMHPDGHNEERATVRAAYFVVFVIRSIAATMPLFEAPRRSTPN
jgi:hypothetical protein